MGNAALTEIGFLSLANCYFADDSPEFQRNVKMLH
jgi:hypothetical protein